ncbi:hypothetical protein LIER_33919 [Lithospermum erythrorhizon]|uniref:RNase H type-1 domain-containing protein n=1 Tax=Lithospermum erythrorhizon TaxID=34254 RepID=A0AAV3S2U8_LITER
MPQCKIHFTCESKDTPLHSLTKRPMRPQLKHKPSDERTDAHPYPVPQLHHRSPLERTSKLLSKFLCKALRRQPLNMHPEGTFVELDVLRHYPQFSRYHDNQIVFITPLTTYQHPIHIPGRGEEHMEHIFINHLHFHFLRVPRLCHGHREPPDAHHLFLSHAHFHEQTRRTLMNSGSKVRLLKRDDGSWTCRLREGLGIATNNVAKYRGMILRLKAALQKGFTTIRVQGDSKLLDIIVHVLRDLNSEADAQANLALELADGQVEEVIDK